jgi:F-type H+-transporting ATPase subunit b
MALLQVAEFWVAVALLLFFGLLVCLKVPSAVASGLDGYAQKIQNELDEAQRLREESQTLLASIKQQREQAERQAAEMIAAAEADAARLAVEAKAKLDEEIARRQALAERRIAAAEVAAAAEVKSVAAELAAQMTGTILQGRLKGLKNDPLIDRAVAQMADKLQ